MEILYLEKIKYENNQNYVYRSLKNSILRIAIKPGEFISELSLQSHFNVSRSPIREAISRLVSEDLIEVIPQVGSRVSFINKEYIRQSNFLRQTMEKNIVEKIFEERDTVPLSHTLHTILDKAILYENLSELEKCFMLNTEVDKEFHTAIFSYVNCLEIWNIIRNKNFQYERFLNLYLVEQVSGGSFLKNHRELADFIENKDNTNCSARFKKNIMDCNEIIKIIYTKYPHYFDDSSSKAAK